MPESIDLDFAGTQLRLLAARGAYWPAQRALLVADTHFGKEATFRRHSIPVPRGSTIGTLQSIARMLASTNARRLVILGDMFHARSSLSRDVRDSLESFFTTLEGISITLVRGNHDAHLGQLPRSWPVEIVEPGEQIESVALSHHPTAVPPGATLLLCGHVHPAIRFGSLDETLKLPCFWYSNQRLVFPAIGEFTGTEVIRRRGGDRVWIIADDQILEAKPPHKKQRLETQ